jgi:hypothetical protein
MQQSLLSSAALTARGLRANPQLYTKLYVCPHHDDVQLLPREKEYVCQSWPGLRGPIEAVATCSQISAGSTADYNGYLAAIDSCARGRSVRHIMEDQG